MSLECNCDCQDGVCVCRRCGRSYRAPHGSIRAHCPARPLPGTEMKALLSRIGITASPTCSCNKMARQMDSWGPDESLAHMEEIVDVMEDTAQSRKLPFLRAGARQLVRLACWKARRKAARGQ